MSQWFLYLHGHGNCSNALHGFLDIIQQHMLVLEPDSRWQIKKILEERANVLAGSRQQGRASDYCCVGIPWPTSIPPDFPPVWNEDEAQGRQTIWNTQLATKSYLDETYLSDSGLTKNIHTPTKVVHSRQQLEQFGKSFFRNSGAPGAVNIRLIRHIFAVTGSRHALRSNNTMNFQSVMEGETSGRRDSARSRPSSGTTSEGRRRTADSRTPVDDESSSRRKRRRSHSVEESETTVTRVRRL